MTTARDDYQALRGVQYEGLVLRDVVFHQTVRRLDSSDGRGKPPVTLRELPRDGTREPRAGKEFRPSFVLDESPPSRIVFLANGHQWIVLATLGSGPAIEDSPADVDDGHRARISLHPFAAESEQTGNVVQMVMSQDDFMDAREVHVQFTGVRRHGVRVCSRVEQDAVAVRFNEGGEAPFTEPGRFSDEHGREHGDP